MLGCPVLDKVAPACQRQGAALACGSILLFGGASAHPQDIEPRVYSNAPVGVNFLIAGYDYTRGGLAFDPALSVSDPDLETSNAVLAYARVLDLWGKSGKLDIILPYTWLSGSANRSGGPVERVVDGFRRSQAPALDQSLWSAGAQPNHHDRGLLAPEYESRQGLVHAVFVGGGAEARSLNVWWLDPEA